MDSTARARARGLIALLGAAALAGCPATHDGGSAIQDGGVPGLDAAPLATAGPGGLPPGGVGTGGAGQAAPQVRVVPGATPEPRPPGVSPEPSAEDPEPIPELEDVITLEAPGDWRGGNGVHLQLVAPTDGDPGRASTMAVAAVELELRHDGVFRDAVVLKTRIEGARLAAGQVPILLSGIKGEDYELELVALDRAGDRLGRAERDFELADDAVVPLVARLPEGRADFAIDEAPRPYLQGGTPTTMTLLWTSGHDVTPAIAVADAAGKAVVRRDGPRGKRHRFALEGLTPGTRYTWLALEEGAEVASGTFRTNAPATERKVRFAAFGDSGRGGRPQFEIGRRMLAWKPDFAVVAGDVVYPRGEAKHYGPRFLAPYRDLVAQAVIYPSLGNHDYMSADGQPYLDFFEVPREQEADTERYYTFRWGHAAFWALDSNQAHGPESAQTKWLARTLAASDATWKVAFFHHPPYSGGWHGSDEGIRRDWEPLFEEHDVQLVISGHDHHYERMKPQEGYVKDGVPTHHVLTGGGGASLRGVKPQAFTAFAAEKHHFVGVTIDDRTLELEAVDLDGKRFDFFRYVLAK